MKKLGRIRGLRSLRNSAFLALLGCSFNPSNSTGKGNPPPGTDSSANASTKAEKSTISSGSSGNSDATSPTSSSRNTIPSQVTANLPGGPLFKTSQTTSANSSTNLSPVANSIFATDFKNTATNSDLKLKAQAVLDILGKANILFDASNGVNQTFPNKSVPPPVGLSLVDSLQTTNPWISLRTGLNFNYYDKSSPRCSQVFYLNSSKYGASFRYLIPKLISIAAGDDPLHSIATLENEPTHQIPQKIDSKFLIESEYDSQNHLLAVGADSENFVLLDQSQLGAPDLKGEVPRSTSELVVNLNLKVIKLHTTYQGFVLVNQGVVTDNSRSATLTRETVSTISAGASEPSLVENTQLSFLNNLGIKEDDSVQWTIDAKTASTLAAKVTTEQKMNEIDKKSVGKYEFNLNYNDSSDSCKVTDSNITFQ